MKESIIQKIHSAPHESGVYIFYGSRKSNTSSIQHPTSNILYVGKAADLKNRLRSYVKITDIKTEMLHENATKLAYIVLRSEIEALIEESRLIKELKPKYNVLWQDDKSYSYVYFTHEIFPKIFIGHENLSNRYSLTANHSKRIGPFTDGAALRLVLKMLRHYFPYCTCFRPHLRDCLNAQMGRCLGFCCKGVIANNSNLPQKNNANQYLKNIKSIKMVLRGQSKKLLKTLSDRKEKIALENIFSHREYIRDAVSEFESRHRTSNIPHLTSDIQRVECYDLSNLSGKEAVGVMTVLKNGESDKSQWRTFKIKSAPTRDDPRMMREIISRRLNHPEWPYPDLMIIDGGITQFRAARNALARHPISHLSRPTLISFAKPQKLVYGLKSNDEPTPITELAAELQKLIEKAIYYTHGFAIRYHRKVRGKELFR